MDGTPVQKTYWDEGEPDNAIGDEDCVGIIPYKDGQWTDVKCDKKKAPFLCQKPTPGEEELTNWELRLLLFKNNQNAFDEEIGLFRHAVQ